MYVYMYICMYIYTLTYTHIIKKNPLYVQSWKLNSPTSMHADKT